MAKTDKRTTSTLALSVRQPWADAIMRGVKMIEYRSRPANVRGSIYIYASLGRYSQSDEESFADQVGLTLSELDHLLRGVVLGTVELFDCVPMAGGDGFEWRMRSPQRLLKPRKPTRRVNPVWTYPW